MVVSFRWLALTALLLAPVASATTLLAEDVASLTRSSSAVVRGTVVESKARWTADKARIVTETTVTVSERWKGDAAATVVIQQPGGEVGEVGQLVHGVARFRPGEEIVVFLEARGPRFLVTGMLQGKFLVEKSSDGKATFARQELQGEALFLDPATRQPVHPVPTVVPLDELRAQVLQHVAAQAPANAPTAPAPKTPVKATP
jgi:hypothetical protein